MRAAGLPFVFAMWVARAGVDATTVAPLLAGARDRGTENLAAIAAEESSALGLTEPECLGYLRDNLHFTLGADECLGLEQFYRQAAELDLAPKGIDLGLADCRTAG